MHEHPEVCCDVARTFRSGTGAYAGAARRHVHLATVLLALEIAAAKWLDTYSEAT